MKSESLLQLCFIVLSSVHPCPQASELGIGVLFAALLMSDEMGQDRISLPSNDIENAIPHALSQSQLLLQVGGAHVCQDVPKELQLLCC